MDKENLKAACSNWFYAKNEILNNNRFFPKHHDDFLKVIDLLCQTSTKILVKDTILFRSRLFEKYNNKISKDKDFCGFNKKDSFVPPLSISSDGRLNPKLIRYLYTAEDEITSIMETKPILEECVSVAEIKLNENLKIANLVYFDKINSIDECFRFLLSRELSQPIRDKSDYFFSQYISEYIKNLGYDGIRFNSSINKSGVNITIFSYNKCEAISSKLYSLHSINMQAKPISPKKGKLIKNKIQRYGEERLSYGCPDSNSKNT